MSRVLNDRETIITEIPMENIKHIVVRTGSSSISFNNVKLKVSTVSDKDTYKGEPVLHVEIMLEDGMPFSGFMTNI